MIPLPLLPKIIQKRKNQAVFQIGGLYPGYGVTIGNALRRVLLSSMSGAAVTQVKIKGVQHEFSIIPGILEDVVIILLNLKNLRFKIFEGEVQEAQLKTKGEKEIKGSDFKLPPQVELANPECHIATITNKTTEFEIEIQIEKGVGYEPLEQRKKKESEIGTIFIDAIFTPIKRVNFQVENMRVGERTDFDKLNLEIETDGTITPEQAFIESCQILIKHFSLFVETSKNLSKKQKISELKPVEKASGPEGLKARREKGKKRRKKEFQKQGKIRSVSKLIAKKKKDKKAKKRLKNNEKVKKG